MAEFTDMLAQIELILERIRPALAMHGGDIELIKLVKKDKVIQIRFHGNCEHCAISEITLRHLVEREMRKEFGEHYIVEAI